MLALVITVAPVAAESHADDAPFASGLDMPVALTFAADGTLYYAELATGNVRALGADGMPSAPVFTVPASVGRNGGFTGLSGDREDADVLYAYYSTEKADGKVNRVSRLHLSSGEETVLLDDIPYADLHNGGRVLVGAEGMLYVTVGDTEVKDSAQDESAITGKVLRMTRDGKPAPGNPEGWHPLAFAKGFRNPFGITTLPDGRVFVSDNGGAEEVNLLERSANYGWPWCTGPCEREGTTDPLASWDEHFGPTGVAVYGDTLYLGDYAKSRVREVDLATGETGVFWEEADARVLDVAVGRDACLYIAGWEAVWRVPLADAACELTTEPQRQDEESSTTNETAFDTPPASGDEDGIEDAEGTSGADDGTSAPTAEARKWIPAAESAPVLVGTMLAALGLALTRRCPLPRSRRGRTRARE